MKIGRWIIASIAATAVFFLFDLLFHGYLLTGLYMQTLTLWRPVAEMERLLPYGYAATFFSSLFLVYIYDRGYEGKVSGLREGLRFGTVIGLFTAVPMAIWSYITLQMMPSLAIGWFINAFLQMLIAGAMIGLIYKK